MKKWTIGSDKKTEYKSYFVDEFISLYRVANFLNLLWGQTASTFVEDVVDKAVHCKLPPKTICSLIAGLTFEHCIGKTSSQEAVCPDVVEIEGDEWFVVETNDGTLSVALHPYGWFRAWYIHGENQLLWDGEWHATGQCPPRYWARLVGVLELVGEKGLALLKVPGEIKKTDEFQKYLVAPNANALFAEPNNDNNDNA